jgi:hypothetical protein
LFQIRANSADGLCDTSQLEIDLHNHIGDVFREERVVLHDLVWLLDNAEGVEPMGPIGEVLDAGIERDARVLQLKYDQLDAVVLGLSQYCIGRSVIKVVQHASSQLRAKVTLDTALIELLCDTVHILVLSSEVLLDHKTECEWPGLRCEEVGILWDLPARYAFRIHLRIAHGVSESWFG